MNHTDEHHDPFGRPALLSRRDLIVGAGVGLVGTLALRRYALAAEDRAALPVIPELRAGADGEILLEARAGSRRFRDDLVTPTYGFNGDYLGPALRVRRCETVRVRAKNGLDEEITLHWHGLKIPGEVDGSPYSIIEAGTERTVELSIEQPAATCWYHPHVYPTTAELVVKGLAGVFVIDDEESDALGLPSRWGVDDIAIVLQDRRFSPDGTFFHRFNLSATTVGYVGDTMLVNGTAYPAARTARGWLRLRLLNGSNARSYRLAASDGRSLFVVASDGGLLAEPVELKELMLLAGERYEVLVDARDGASFDLVTLPVEQLAMALPPFHQALPLVTFLPDGADGTGTLPDSLVALPALVANLPPVSQKLEMGMRLDEEGMALFKKAGLMDMMQSGRMDNAVVERVNRLIVEEPALPLEEQLSANTINGQSFEMGVVPYTARIHQEERWLISEGTDRMTHPVHIHGCQFRILDLNGKPPPPHMAGWKDTAPLSMGGSCEIEVRFDHPASKERPFMAHCHILEHEDSGMMTNFAVA